MTEFAFKLLVTLFPGLISYLLIYFLTSRSELKINECLLYSFVLGMLSYSISTGFLFLVYPKFSFLNEPEFFKIIQSIGSDSDATVPYQELVVALITSILVSVVFSLFITYRLLTRVGNFCKITNKKYTDLWEVRLNKRGWVEVPLYEKKIIYQGWYSKFNSKPGYKEILLENVQTYDYDSGDFIKSNDEVYLTLKEDDIILKFIDTPSESTEENIEDE